MQTKKDINLLTKKSSYLFLEIFLKKSEWIAEEAFNLKPFENTEDLVNKMINIYENTSNEKIKIILNLHPKLAIEKKLTSFSSNEQTAAKFRYMYK